MTVSIPKPTVLVIIFRVLIRLLSFKNVGGNIYIHFQRFEMLVQEKGQDHLIKKVITMELPRCILIIKQHPNLKKVLRKNINANFDAHFFLLVRPPMSQSLLVMGWCSSIPEHRLRLHLDSGPIVNLSLLLLGCNPVYLRSSRVWSVFLLRLCPAPLRPTGATGSQ